MPTYQYYCTECAHEMEVVQKFTEDSLTVCPSCEGLLRKRFNAVGVVFKGSGFYTTDSRAQDANGKKNSADAGANGDADKSDAGDNSNAGEKGNTADTSSGSNSGEATSTSSSADTSSSSSGDSGSSGSGSNGSGSGAKTPAKAGSTATSS